MKSIVILTTGGTIAMAEDEANRSVRPRGPETLRGVLPLMSPHAQITMEHLLNLPSPHITPADMHTISLRVTEYLSRPDVDGIVVTHGTDTLEETAYYLDLVAPGEKPVVLTGAMRSQDEPGADGPPNLVSAVRTAAHERSTGRGVLVVFNDEIHSARRVTKTHTSNVATFRSPSHGPEGTVTKRDILYYRPPELGRLFPQKKPAGRVELIKAAAGSDDWLIRSALAADAGGIVLEALGQGNLPPAMLPGVREALHRNVPVVLVSRCYNGFVEDTYGYEGGGRQLKEMGVIFCNGLNGQKARIRLLAVLNETRDPRQLQRFFRETCDG